MNGKAAAPMPRSRMNSRRLLGWAMSSRLRKATGREVTLRSPVDYRLVRQFTIYPRGVKADDAMISTISLRILKSCAAKNRRRSGSVLADRRRGSAA